MTINLLMLNYSWNDWRTNLMDSLHFPQITLLMMA